MATEDEGGMEDVESSLEPEGEGGGLRETLGNLKDRYVDFHTVDEESENWSDEPALGSISRRGFLAGTAEVAAVGYGISEATDGDGWNVDWSRGNSQGAGGGVGPIGGGGNGNETDAPGGQQAMDGNNQLGTAGDVSDELYLQEDGTVVAIDYGHKEWRKFSPDNFPENSAYAGLHSELEGERSASDLAPPQLGSGIEVSQEELFDYDTAAYDDMADEAEWDLIFDSNPNYEGGN